VNPIDGYLLDGQPSKEAAVAAALTDRHPAEAAQPFYRALELLGPRTPDEALMGLRVAMTAGRPPSDDDIRVARERVAAARSGDDAARAAYLTALGTSG
jgi:hypothetical protein